MISTLSSQLGQAVIWCLKETSEWVIHSHLVIFPIPPVRQQGLHRGILLLPYQYMGPEGASKEQGPKQVTDRPANHQPATPPQNLPWSELGGSQLRPLTSRNPSLSRYVDSFCCPGNHWYVHGRAISCRQMPT